MKPVYKAFKDIFDFIRRYGLLDGSTVEERMAQNSLTYIHDHVCWLNPHQSRFSWRTKRKCHKFCQKYNVPREPYFEKYYDCDRCPNLITVYRYDEDFLFAVGNKYLYEEQGKIK